MFGKVFRAIFEGEFERRVRQACAAHGWVPHELDEDGAVLRLQTRRRPFLVLVTPADGDRASICARSAAVSRPGHFPTALRQALRSREAELERVNWRVFEGRTEWWAGALTACPLARLTAEVLEAGVELVTAEAAELDEALRERGLI